MKIRSIIWFGVVLLGVLNYSVVVFGDKMARTFVVQPTNTSVGQYGTAIFSAVVVGTPPVTYQWYNAGTGMPINGKTNATLVLTNVQTSANQSIYYVEVDNNYGTIFSTNATLTVYSGAPQIHYPTAGGRSTRLRVAQ